MVWDGCTESECDLLEHVQYETAKIVTGAIEGASKHHLALELGWEEMRSRRAVHKIILYCKIVNNLCPILKTYFQYKSLRERDIH